MNRDDNRARPVLVPVDFPPTPRDLTAWTPPPPAACDRCGTTRWPHTCPERVSR